MYLMVMGEHWEKTAMSTGGHFLTRDCHISAYIADVIYLFNILCKKKIKKYFALIVWVESKGMKACVEKQTARTNDVLHFIAALGKT